MSQLMKFSVKNEFSNLHLTLQAAKVGQKWPLLLLIFCDEIRPILDKVF